MTETFFSKSSNYIGSFLLLLSILYYQLQDKKYAIPPQQENREFCCFYSFLHDFFKDVIIYQNILNV